MLIVTNGDSAAFAMQQAGISDEILPWRDVLHDGPVPETDSLDALSRIRAQFVADCGWGSFEETHRSFRHRDERLASVRADDEIVLWFEHDLYDQLQLIQVLDWFERGSPPRTFTLICHDEFISESSHDLIQARFASRVPVTDNQLALSHRAWSAFRSDTPEHMAELCAQEMSALPFLRNAVIRLLQEFPGVDDGLARSERQILAVVRGGAKDRRLVFRQLQELEEAKYLGDWSFDRYVDGLMRPPLPLLTAPEGSRSLALTATGEAVLAGDLDWVATVNMDKWIGGVHLRPSALWRWTGEAAVRD